ncbi:unnamed protein product [Cuscuta campestris]|uniref:Uncharacterized protein n=1 Tax=Cuscuta campestris TaxID=132261 RepID=A0A484K3V5_9ASTE|nr:unnamed protein product [Cuscuta campestris]
MLPNCARYSKMRAVALIRGSVWEKLSSFSRVLRQPSSARSVKKERALSSLHLNGEASRVPLPMADI